MCHNQCCSILAINYVQLNDISFDFGCCVKCFSPFFVFFRLGGQIVTRYKHFYWQFQFSEVEI